MQECYCVMICWRSQGDAVGYWWSYVFCSKKLAGDKRVLAEMTL